MGTRTVKFLVLSSIWLSLWGCQETQVYEKENIKGAFEEARDAAIPRADNVPVPIPDPNTRAKMMMTDTFTQNVASNAKLDILWMVDDSGSMSDEQASLARNFSIFISDFITRGIDFNMAITTTDPGASREGNLRGDVAKLNSVYAQANSADFMNYFQNTIKVGINGSGSEQGLRTSRAAIMKNAAQFMRQDAFLVIIVLSDEEDQSPESTQFYVDYFKSLKANSGMVKVHSIVQSTMPLVGSESLGYRYQEASRQTGGKSYSIKSDFAQSLQDMGEKIVTLVDSFGLSKEPTSNAARVFVNGIEIFLGYTFDAQTRTLHFDNSAVPIVGSSIEVRYEAFVN
jgi:hypothetical protein